MTGTVNYYEKVLKILCLVTDFALPQSCARGQLSLYPLPYTTDWGCA